MSTIRSDMRSPFVERVMTLLPQGHEEAMKQAFYNVAAIGLFIALGSASMAVYFILEPFVKPLLWAVLIGSVLYPLKQKSLIMARKWLSQMDDSNSLLVVECLSIPVKAVDVCAELLGKSLIRHLKLIAFLLIAVPIVCTIQEHYSFSDLFSFFECVLTTLVEVMSVDLVRPIMGACVLGFLGASLALSGQQKFSLAANFGWAFVFCILFIVLGSLSVILIFPAFVFMLIALAIRVGWIDASDVDPAMDEPLARPPQTAQQHPVAVGDHGVQNLTISTPKFPTGISRLMKSHIVTATLTSLSASMYIPTPPPTNKSQSPKLPSSNRYIFRALWACFAVHLWRHMWLLHFLPIPLLFFILKVAGTQFNLWTFLRLRKDRLVDLAISWIDTYKDQIFPKPIQWLYQGMVYLDRTLIKKLIGKLDSVVTVVIISSSVILTVLASVFIAVQIYGESVHLLHLGTSLVNQTVNHPEARQWLPQGIDSMVDLGSMVDNAYAYGKTNIAAMVKNSINEKDPARAAQIEKAILETLDRMQRAWLSQGEHSPSAKLVPSGDVLANANSSVAKPPLLRRLSQDYLNLTVLANYGRENIGSIFSIIESVWTILKGNLSLLVNSATAVLSILIGGGTTILNFLVNGVVFLTALYYLLVASDSQYKPIQLVSFLSPGGGNTLGIAMEDAINTVCMASLKFSAFYGLYTWLTHTVFYTRFVVIPAALAALLGAVPFLGTYWAALPAVLDLWLAQSRGVDAVLLIGLHLAPTLLVDAAFYAEIKGGGHPYLTGLAVAGGIFWLGVEGAIIGPLLLCVLLVAVSVYTTLVQNDTQPPPVDHTANTARWLHHRRLLRTDTVG